MVDFLVIAFISILGSFGVGIVVGLLLNITKPPRWIFAWTLAILALFAVAGAFSLELGMSDYQGFKLLAFVAGQIIVLMLSAFAQLAGAIWMQVDNSGSE